MRSVFGNIKTPFNKHRLMEDLVSFLSRREIREIITAYIDETDHRLIIAIAVLGEPAPGELESFFSGEYSYLDIHGMLLNLEERLIVYRFLEDGVYHLALNPLLAPVLSPLLMEMGVLLPSFSVLPDTEPVPPPDDRILAGLLAFLFDEGEFFKAEGGIRKKVMDDGRRIFLSLDIERLIGGLQIIGLFSSGEGRLGPDTRKFAAFRDLSPLERREYWAGGIYSYCHDPDPITRYPHQGRIRKLAQFVHRFLSVLKEGRVYPRSTLKRLVEILERDEAGNLLWGEVGMIPLSIGVAGTGDFLEALEAAGLMVLVKDPGVSPETAAGTASAGPEFYRLIPVPASPSDEVSGPVIAMDAAFSCILYPEIPFEDALILAAFCSLREAGTVVRFELTRESVVRGFDFGLDASAMIGHLERLSEKSVDQNLRWTLQDWGNRYSGVALHQGTVLVLSEDRRYLVQAGPIASLIARTLAPGVYLLSCRGHTAPEMDEALQGLRKAGIDIIARPPLLETDALPDSWLYIREEAGTSASTAKAAPIRSLSPYPPLKTAPLFPDPVLNGFSRQMPEAGAGSSLSVPRDARACQECFHLALRKLSLSKPDVDELAARIDRRLILNESQLAGGTVRGEKMEARNLDYVGKTMLAKQAIALKSPVEVHWVAPEGEPNRLMGVPGALEKRGGETVLVLTPLPGGDEIRLSLGKISLLRRIKQSIFGE
jgi:hypothetical protein